MPSSLGLGASTGQNAWYLQRTVWNVLDIKQITGLKSADITLTLEIGAKVESGLDRSMSRTRLRNAEVYRFSIKRSADARET